MATLAPTSPVAAVDAIVDIEGQAVVHTVAGLRRWIADRRRESPGATVALVPTMGALHEGHLRLCDVAATHADHVVVSIFVNPLQFAPHEDLARYPRTLAADCRRTASRGVGLIFAPTVVEMYPEGHGTRVEVDGVSEGLCSVTRPHFFKGVARVVLALLNAAMADVAVFGEKDWQQLQVIRRMVRDLHHPTRVVGAPLVRDNDGLALSSRNVYLSADERQRALSLPRALAAAAAAAATGVIDAATLIAEAEAAITGVGGRVDYIAICHPETLQPQTHVRARAQMLAAVYFGATRLLDNVRLEGPDCTHARPAP